MIDWVSRCTSVYHQFHIFYKFDVETYLEPCQTYMTEFFLQKQEMPQIVNCLYKKASSWMFEGVSRCACIFFAMDL